MTNLARPSEARSFGRNSDRPRDIHQADLTPTQLPDRRGREVVGPARDQPEDRKALGRPPVLGALGFADEEAGIEAKERSDAFGGHRWVSERPGDGDIELLTELGVSGERLCPTAHHRHGGAKVQLPNRITKEGDSTLVGIEQRE